MDDDDVPQLSADTLAALSEFYQEQALLQKQQQVEGNVMPEEDWQLSQFWYSSETADSLCKEALAAAGDQGSIACISCPTLYNKLRQEKPDTVNTVLLEFDKRFDKYGKDFIYYDYNNPLDLSKEYSKAFDIVFADPPFLSEECITKTAQTIRFLAKEKILVCTGAIMEDYVLQLLSLKKCDYLPKHKNNLANEFRCYANYKTNHL